jgi:hypothetical protein
LDKKEKYRALELKIETSEKNEKDLKDELNKAID